MGVSISMLSFDADQSQICKGQPAAHIHSIHMFTVTFASLF